MTSAEAPVAAQQIPQTDTPLGHAQKFTIVALFIGQLYAIYLRHLLYNTFKADTVDFSAAITPMPRRALNFTLPRHRHPSDAPSFVEITLSHAGINLLQ